MLASWDTLRGQLEYVWARVLSLAVHRYFNVYVLTTAVMSLVYTTVT